MILWEGWEGVSAQSDRRIALYAYSILNLMFYPPPQKNIESKPPAHPPPPPHTHKGKVQEVAKTSDQFLAVVLFWLQF